MNHPIFLFLRELSPWKYEYLGFPLNSLRFSAFSSSIKSNTTTQFSGSFNNSATKFDPMNPTFLNVPRPQFLGLLKNCKRFITNSSAAYYEAPAFLLPEQIIIVGDRNKERSSNFYGLTPLIEGASNRIIDELERWWKNTWATKYRTIDPYKYI